MPALRQWILVCAICIGAPITAQPSPELAARLSQPIEVERTGEISALPIARHMGKLAIAASVNSIERQFIFDTGSPTMIAKELADQLELDIIGSNVGRDANGREVRTEFAIVERLDLGGVRFTNVPVMIFDFKAIDPDGCFFDGGVIGSEIFPGSAWRIDADNDRLEISAWSDNLTQKEDEASTISAPLARFGYPHAPIFGYRIGTFEDRGLFDTGNSASIVLFNRVAGDARVQRQMQAGSIVEGRGSEGVSAGGLGDSVNLLRFELTSFELGASEPGASELGPLPGIIRHAPPTLMGLGVMAKYNVTLDYPGSRIILEERAKEEERLPHPGYGLMVANGDLRVMQLYAGTKAESAGLMLGDHVVAIDGSAPPASDHACALHKWLIEDRPAANATSLTVSRDGQEVLISLAQD
ncbi:MAG: aspartyl protease family protein [Erythrobacter sp.]|nr:aspartyl protease family protein [Erythrobacter sp.]